LLVVARVLASVKSPSFCPLKAYSTTTLSEYFAADHTNLSTSFGPFSSVKTYCLAVSELSIQV
jgi:hypothetical protein